MLAIPPDFGRNYAPLSANHGAPQRPYYLKWLRYHLDFCQKFALTPTDRRSFTAFDEKLREKNQSDDQRRQARQAMALYYRSVHPNGDFIPAAPPCADQGSGGPIPVTDTPTAAAPREPTCTLPSQTNNPPVVKPLPVMSHQQDNSIPPPIRSAVLPQASRRAFLDERAAPRRSPVGFGCTTSSVRRYASGIIRRKPLRSTSSGRNGCKPIPAARIPVRSRWTT